MKLQAKVAVPLVAAVAIAADMGAGSTRSSRKAVLDPARNQFLFSATEIIDLPGGDVNLDSNIARLDTRNGAIYRFRGNTDNPSVRNTWEMRVPPVTDETSGLLEIQTIVPAKRTNVHDPTERDPAVFLVDIVNGSTWILRRDASTNARWDAVEIFRSAQFH